MRGLRRLRKVRPVAVAYVLVVLFLLGVLINRRLPAGREMPEWALGPAVPALAQGLGGTAPGAAPGTAAGAAPGAGAGTGAGQPAPAGYGAGGHLADDEEWIPPATPPWLLLFRPDRQLARTLLEESIPLLERGSRTLVLYGEVGPPQNLFAAIFPFLGRPPTVVPPPEPGGVGPAPGQWPVGRQPAGGMGGAAAPGGQGSMPSGRVGDRPGTGGLPGAGGGPGAGNGSGGGYLPGQGLPGQSLPDQSLPGQNRPPVPPAGAAEPPNPGAGLPPEAGCRRPPGVAPVGKGIPLVAIYHTHDYESYISEFPGLNPQTDAEWGSVWTTNPERNIIRVGRELARALCERGVTVVHSPTRHAPPMGYLGAYTESRKTAEFILEKYPSIRLLLDLHRDGETVDESELTVRIGGRQAATLLLVVGTGHAEAPQPHWQENLTLARRVAAAMDQRYPGLLRGIKPREGARYNQDLHPGALLIEVGSVRNQMDEALWSVELLAEILADDLRASIDGGGPAGTGMGAGE